MVLAVMEDLVFSLIRWKRLLHDYCRFSDKGDPEKAFFEYYCRIMLLVHKANAILQIGKGFLVN